MEKWGTLNLNIQDYKILPTKVNLVEKKLIKAYNSHITKAPCTTIQGTGRGSRKRQIAGWCTTEEYLILESDSITGIKKTVIFDDGFSMTATISEVSKEMKKLKDDGIMWYSALFTEF